jgi:hypothetical protein
VTVVYNCTPFFDGADVAALGTVYFGVVNEDPLTNPKNPTTLAGVLIPSRVTLTSAGMMPYSVVIDDTYSILVQNFAGDAILYQYKIDLPDMSATYLLTDGSTFYDKITGEPLVDPAIYYGYAYRDPVSNPATIDDGVDLSIQVDDSDGLTQFSCPVISNTFPNPPGVPNSATRFALGMDYWEAYNINIGVTVAYSAPRYNAGTGLYSGGWVGTHTTGVQWGIRSKGTWANELPIQNIYALINFHTISGGIAVCSLSSSKRLQVLPGTNYLYGSAGDHLFIASGSIPEANSNEWTFNASAITYTDQISIIAIYGD